MSEARNRINDSRTMSMTAVGSEELARLHRIEEAAREALRSYFNDYESETDSTAHDALRAALEEKT